ncbi:MAG: winged helix-turn-helix domain-containing protein [Methanosarcina flavescens]|jgi:predicted transcriptional regulator|uniref:ArsR family transcriptional regulator n=1 Tax=Methanosarcina flavescens TaxID=1715806 RepID=A0A660HRF3_9EURY|nr:winged helix-turn-helix domain-containing protein [Methanosarcina flavescens]AYK14802.1 ArsR family transcriptional regulator [Methanosarcina flavescens]NLK33270.1 winged helix-turn-helix transcriptional regulator [Methanosarcina flavescens]
MTPEEAAKRKEEWVAKMKKEGRMKEDMTEDHKACLNALQNPVRRNILKALVEQKKSLEEIKTELKLTDSQASYNLNTLESTLCIEKEENEGVTYYILTPRGEGYMKNVELKK